jgi:predicted Rossmann-fold nucleotide-binding protein
MKIAIIGNTDWQNRRKVKETLQQLKRKFGKDLHVIGGGGTEGANHMVKKYALEFDLVYSEYNPSFSGFNMYSAMPETYYGKSYHFSQLHHRMKLIAEACEYMIIMSNQDKLDPVLQTAYKTATKLQKPVVILS